MKLLIALAFFFTAFSASANDGALPFIKVQGVNPNGNPVNSKIEVYGRDMGEFFNALPVDFVEPEHSRSIHFISGSWQASIACTKNYVRPTTGFGRTDHKCEFSLYRHDGLFDKDGHLKDGGDSYKVDDSSLGRVRDRDRLSVIGINPVNIKNKNMVYSFYGKGTHLVANKLINRGPIRFFSKKYNVTLSCQKSYNHPNTGVRLHDYKCQLSLKNN